MTKRGMILFLNYYFLVLFDSIYINSEKLHTLQKLHAYPGLYQIILTSTLPSIYKSNLPVLMYFLCFTIVAFHSSTF